MEKNWLLKYAYIVNYYRGKNDQSLLLNDQSKSEVLGHYDHALLEHYFDLCHTYITIYHREHLCIVMYIHMLSLSLPVDQAS